MTSRAPELLLLGAGGWHGRQLVRALAARGWRGRPIAFSKLGFATQAHGLRLGRSRALPAAALIRSIPAGSFEQVTFRLSVLHALVAMGVPVVNGPRAIERCVDKAMTTFLMRRAGLPVPETWTTEDEAMARTIVAGETLRGRVVVSKPLFGSQGRGLRLLRHAGDLPPPIEVAGVYYLQRFVGGEGDWQDYRVLVIDDEPVAAMLRRGLSWVTNVSQGAVPEAVSPAGELGALAVAAARAVGAVYAGVDLIRDGQGRLLLLEVNSMPAWQGLQQVTNFRIADRLAAAITARGAMSAAA